MIKLLIVIYRNKFVTLRKWTSISDSNAKGETAKNERERLVTWGAQHSIFTDSTFGYEL